MLRRKYLENIIYLEKKTKEEWERNYVWASLGTPSPPRAVVNAGLEGDFKSFMKEDKLVFGR